MKEKSHILDRVHAEMGTIDEAAVEPLEIDDGAPTHRLWDEEETRKVAGGGRGDLLYGALPLKGLHLRVDEVHVLLTRNAGEGRRGWEGDGRRMSEGDGEAANDLQY